MILTRLPRRVYDVLSAFKGHFSCPQGRHFVLWCWLLVALVLDTGQGTLKSFGRLMPSHIRYWALLRLVRCGQWDAQALVDAMVAQVLPFLPAPPDGVLYLIVDSTLKEKRGAKGPLCRKARSSAYAPYTFGFEMVLLVASWGYYRIPVKLAVINPRIKGHQNILAREMLQNFAPPSWARQVIVSGDAGFAATETFQTIQDQGYSYVFALARTRKLANGQHLRDIVGHMPHSRYRRVASSKPDGRRRDYWVFSRCAQLEHLGDVTIVLSKQRRNYGPKRTKILVTNLHGQQAKAGYVLSCYARRWDIEVTFKELKGGLHLGKMQVTKDPARVERSVLVSVMAYLLLLRLYGRQATNREEVSLFRLKQRFSAEVFQDQLNRSEQKWRAKFRQFSLATAS